MREGTISHDEVNAAIAAAPKTIIFGRQNRLSDGVLLPDVKLPRFHAGHDSVKFFYSAVRQLPEYLLDALLAKGVSVTLVLGEGLLVFRDVRCHQAIHCGRTRRTIYVPGKVLDVAVRSGYDYWSLTQVLVTEGWKLLDYVLLLELIQGARQHILEHAVPVLGWHTVRRLLAAANRHRSAFESQELAHKREAWGLDVPVSEIEEFTAEYEKKVLRAMRFGGDGRLGRAIPLQFRQMSPQAVAHALYNDALEEAWAERKAREVAQEQSFPDYFLLDRDIVHPAARELAAAAGQTMEPRAMGEARHDYQDRMRFGIGPELATEWLVQQGVRFAPEGLAGLAEEIAAGVLASGQVNGLLLEKTMEALLRLVARGDRWVWVLGGSAGAAHGEDVVARMLERAVDLFRLRDMVAFNARVRSGEQRLELGHLELLREQMVRMAGLKGPTGDAQRQLILGLQRVQDLFPQLKAVLLAEAKRLLGPEVKADEVDPPHPLLARLAAEVERTMLRLTLCLELMPGYSDVLERLARQGSSVAEEVLARFLAWAAQDPDRQVAVAAARRGLAARRGRDLGADEGGSLADLPQRVEAIVALLPARVHGATSGGITRVRRALREFENARRAGPTSPRQLGALAMVLVRLDRHERYAEMLDHIRWMGDHAVGHLVKGGGLNRYYTPGLLRVIDEEGPERAAIGANALALAVELTGAATWQALKRSRVRAG